MAKREKRSRVDVAAPAGPSHNPFAAALAGLTAPPQATPEDDVTEAVPARPAVTPRTRVDRKGRAGKTVTLVEGLEQLTPPEIEELAREMRKALGTGARVEGEVIVVQGDASDRVKAWFAARGDGGV